MLGIHPVGLWKVSIRIQAGEQHEQIRALRGFLHWGEYSRKGKKEREKEGKKENFLGVYPRRVLFHLIITEIYLI